LAPFIAKTASTLPTRSTTAIVAGCRAPALPARLRDDLLHLRLAERSCAGSGNRRSGGAEWGGPRRRRPGGAANGRAAAAPPQDDEQQAAIASDVAFLVGTHHLSL
jgi:hypothetical protein